MVVGTAVAGTGAAVGLGVGVGAGVFVGVGATVAVGRGVAVGSELEQAATTMIARATIRRISLRFIISPSPSVRPAAGLCCF